MVVWGSCYRRVVGLAGGSKRDLEREVHERRVFPTSLSDIITSGEPVKEKKEKKIQDIPRRHKFKNQLLRRRDINPITYMTCNRHLLQRKESEREKKIRFKKNFIVIRGDLSFFFFFSFSSVRCLLVCGYDREGRYPRRVVQVSQPYHGPVGV